MHIYCVTCQIHRAQIHQNEWHYSEIDVSQVERRVKNISVHVVCGKIHAECLCVIQRIWLHDQMSCKEMLGYAWKKTPFQFGCMPVGLPDNWHIFLVPFMVNTNHKHWCVSRGGRNDHLLSSSFNVGLYEIKHFNLQ